MKYIVTLSDVAIDINNEYKEYLERDLYLGVIDGDSFQEAEIKAKHLEEECYNDYSGACYLGYPELKIEKV